MSAKHRQNIAEAKCDLDQYALDLIEKYNIDYDELMYIVAEVLFGMHNTNMKCKKN